MEGNFGVFRLVLFEKFAQNYPSVKRILRGTFLYNYKINAQFSIKKHGSLTYRTNLVLYFISQKKFMEKLKISILQHISKGDTQKAFDLLNHNIDSSSHLCNMITIIEANFNTIGFLKITGEISLDKYIREINKINNSLISICQLIKKEDLIVVDSNDESTKHKAYYLIQRAENYRKNKEFEKAIHDLSDASRQQPKNIAIQNDLARCYRLIGKYSEALNIFDNIIDKRPNDVLSLNELATCQRELERYSAALETLNRGLMLQPDNNHFHSNKFFIHLFFTLNKNEAIAVRDYYENTYGKKLILKTELNELYYHFLENFEAIHNLSIDENLVRQYIDECMKKRALKTAKTLLLKLDKGNNSI